MEKHPLVGQRVHVEGQGFGQVLAVNEDQTKARVRCDSDATKWFSMSSIERLQPVTEDSCDKTTAESRFFEALSTLARSQFTYCSQYRASCFSDEWNLLIENGVSSLARKSS